MEKGKKDLCRFGGMIHLAGPKEIFDELISKGRIIFDDGPAEFSLEYSEAPVLHFKKMEPWFYLAEGDTELVTEAKDDEFHARFSVCFKDGTGREFDLTFSTEQARALAEILSGYVKARDIWEALKPNRKASKALD